MDTVKEQRKALEEEYQVKDGMIQTPGKFETEAIFVPYYWNAALDGGGDEIIYEEDGTPADIFEISEEEREAFPELEDYKYIAVWESDQGFVYHELVNEIPEE